MKANRWMGVVVLGAALALAGCGEGDRRTAEAAGRGGGPGAGGGRGGAGAPGPESLPVRDVRVAQAATETLARTVPVAGTLAADEQARLGLKVGGRIASVGVDLGDRVRRGQAIARLVPTEFELRVSQAQNLLDQARSRLGVQPGKTSTVVSPVDTAVVKQAAASLNQARLTRDRMTNLF
ncbi:MAG TPA: biotin/lipoyl-binding protein, partial [Thermoanaerobaculia bacterium]|nr:biotin/lipoyl-binding protein [Thermoanaerobaculia bacterium]